MEYIDTVNDLMKEISENFDMDVLEFWELVDEHEKRKTLTPNEAISALRQIRLKIDRVKRVGIGSIPTFDEAEKIFREVVQLHPGGESSEKYPTLVVKREKEHVGHTKVTTGGMPYRTEKIRTTFEDSLSIKSYGYYVINYDGQTGQVLNRGFEHGLKSKTEETKKEIRKLRSDINSRLGKLLNEKLKRQLGVE